MKKKKKKIFAKQSFLLRFVAFLSVLSVSLFFLFDISIIKCERLRST